MSGCNSINLENRVTVEGSENAAISFKLAGLGSRMISALLDYLLIMVTLFFLNLVMAMSGAIFVTDNIIVSIVVSLIVLMNFLIAWGYFITFELMWQGQTPGKKVMNIKAVRDDGRPLDFLNSFLRNILRIIDVFLNLIPVGIVFMFINSREKRLGDMLGGTVVVKTPQPVKPVSPRGKISSLSPATGEMPGCGQLENRLHHLEVEEIEMLREYLMRYFIIHPDYRGRLNQKFSAYFAEKLGVNPPEDRAEQFLEYLRNALFGGSR